MVAKTELTIIRKLRPNATIKDTHTFLRHDDILLPPPRADGAAFSSRRLEHQTVCLDGTRTDLLSEIELWSHNLTGASIF